MANKNKLRHKNSKSVLKTSLILISVIGVITFLIISYLIYSLQCYAYDNNISSDNLNLSVLIKSMPYWTNPTFTAPFDIGAIMQMHGSVWYIYVVALSLLALMLFSKNYDDYKGVEAGSADWATKRDEKENSDETGIPIGNKFYVTVNNPHGRYYEPHNLNEILIGGPGAGKTFRKIKPDIIQMYGSYVVTDPKGELYRDTAKLLMDNGYKVRVFNLINIKKTNAYNPFVYINDEQDIVVLANTFINASAGDDDKEDFWSGSAKSLLTAIMIYLWKAEGEVKCFGRVVRLLNSITYKNGRIDELCELARCLNKHSIEHPCDAATINWNGIKGTPEETMGGIAKTLSTRLDLWAVEDVNDLTVIDEMDFDNIGVEKTAIEQLKRAKNAAPENLDNGLPFSFSGQITDLSYFNTNDILPKEVIDSIPDAELKEAVISNLELAEKQGLIDVDLNNGNITLTDSGREYINNPNFIRAANIDKARSAIRAMEIQHGLENDTIRYGITLEGTDRDLQFFRFASNLDLEEITLSPDKKAALQVMENISKWEKDGLVQYNSDNTSISLTKLGQKKLYSDLADGVDLIDESVIAPKNLSSGSLSNAGAGSMATQATSQTAVQTTQVASATATQATTAGATQAATTAATTATTAASSAVPVAGAVVVTTKVVSDTAKKISDAIIRR